ncbi:MAG: LSM domain-containing protein [Thermoproteota archaeon]|nr:ribonucleoprotein [Candidatus Brockarchaeota archaeon]
MAGQSVQEAVNKRPLLVLRSMIGKNVFLRLKNDHSIYKGKLLNVDAQMNIIMGGTMEYEGGKEVVNFDLILVRGSNVLFVGKADDL